MLKQTSRLVAAALFSAMVIIAIFIYVPVHRALAASVTPVTVSQGPWNTAGNGVTTLGENVTTNTDSYILVGVTADRTSGSDGEQVASVAGGGLTWTKLGGGTTPNAEADAEFWGAYSPAPFNATVTVTMNDNANTALSIISLKGVNLSSPAGVVLAPAEASGNLSATFAGTTAGSMLFATGFSLPYDWESVSGGSGTTVYANINSATQHIRSTDAVAGGAQTIASTGYTSGSTIEYSGVEILGAPIDPQQVAVSGGPWGYIGTGESTGTATVSTDGPSYLLVGVTADGSGAQPQQVVSVAGGGLAWTKLVGGTTADNEVASEFWGASSSGPLTNAAITITLENSANFAMNILSLANVRAAGPIGVKIDAAVATGNLSATFSGTTAGSMLFAISFSRPYDWEILGAGAGTAVYEQQNVAQTIRSTGTTGGAQTISSSGYTQGSNLEYAGVEILGPARGGSAKSPVIVLTPSLVIGIPPAAASYGSGSVVGLSWVSANGSFVKYKVYYSPDGGATWNSVGETGVSSLSWTVPDAGTASGKIRVDGYDGSGNLLASALSVGNIVVISAAPQATVQESPKPAETTPAAAGPTASGAYTPSMAFENNPDINVDLGLAVADRSSCVSGTLIKGSLPSVYYCGADGERHVFTTSRVYFSWYADFSSVLLMSDAQLALIPLGADVTYRPGKLMVKAQTDPKIYVVARGGLLRWIPTAAKAKELYGANWERLIDYVPDAFFFDYTIGSSL